ncbi:hypothetical protein [Borrelia sp. RT5S]|uniref:hypothetical protein n=1 Tax=Borrelia sp. RT5S TaxID=2898581 RepID=UPI001E4F084B|nr:hypothetical protein [Borrelia sp. RT5S]UGQ16602.1 hypothetical protein LSO06_04625 [Borrelia sp. RT5S]
MPPDTAPAKETASAALSSLIPFKADRNLPISAAGIPAAKAEGFLHYVFGGPKHFNAENKSRFL